MSGNLAKLKDAMFACTDLPLSIQVFRNTMQYYSIEYDYDISCKCLRSQQTSI